MDFKNKKVLVIGLGKSGFEAAKLAKNAGAEVFVTEHNSDEVIHGKALVLKNQGIEVETGGHSKRFLKDIELAVISPGISIEEPFIKENILSSNIPMIGEIELAFNLCKSNKIIAVTGTNGKSTVVELITHILKKAGKKAVVCGNIGRPFSAACGEIDEDTVVVIEISSYQLETIKKFKPAVSVILNITEDHLDRYDSMRDYTLAKTRVFENQGKKETCVLNLDDENTKALLPYIKKTNVMPFSVSDKKTRCFVDAEKIIFKKDGRQIPVCSVKDLPFSGNHNISNTLASVSAVSFFMPVDLACKGIESFSPLDHRVQFVKNISGVDFMDDSKATNVEAVIKAIESLDKKIILICGGRNKKNDFEKVKEAAVKKVKLAVAIGESKEEIAAVFNNSIKTEFAYSMPSAVKLAFDRAQAGDCVLLSPMCASFDMFKDYKDRGDCFKKAVFEIEREIKCVPKE
ncbi:MAG: UDP-N-acetylmuramoyl-L-alanine--D-glutamate ligase [Candidatus Omnitrophota bacterium]